MNASAVHSSLLSVDSPCSIHLMIDAKKSTMLASSLGHSQFFNVVALKNWEWPGDEVDHAVYWYVNHSSDYCNKLFLRCYKRKKIKAGGIIIHNLLIVLKKICQRTKDNQCMDYNMLEALNGNFLGKRYMHEGSKFKNEPKLYI